MNLLAPISSIMSSDLITIEPNDSMKKVEDIFNANPFHHLPVVENDNLVGIVSKSDFNLFKRGFVNNAVDAKIDFFRLKAWKVSNIMTKGLGKMDVKDRVNVALEVFSKNLFRAILITKENKLVGIVTPLDIIKHLAKDKEAINSYNL